MNTTSPYTVITRGIRGFDPPFSLLPFMSCHLLRFILVIIKFWKRSIDFLLAMLLNKR